MTYFYFHLVLIGVTTTTSTTVTAHPTAKSLNPGVYEHHPHLIDSKFIESVSESSLKLFKQLITNIDCY